MYPVSGIFFLNIIFQKFCSAEWQQQPEDLFIARVDQNRTESIFSLLKLGCLGIFCFCKSVWAGSKLFEYTIGKSSQALKTFSTCIFFVVSQNTIFNHFLIWKLFKHDVLSLQNLVLLLDQCISITLEKRHLLSNIGHKDFCPSPSVTLKVPPLDSETGLTGDFWSNTNLPK